MMIRKAVRADIPQILRLLLQVNLIHHNGRPDLFKGPVTKYDAQQLCELLADAASPVFVCVEKETVLGYIFCAVRETPDSHMMVGHTTLFVNDLCVDETARGQGIGKALMEHARGFAKETGCHSLTLNVWACNEEARRFYETIGMKERLRVMELLL